MRKTSARKRAAAGPTPLAYDIAGIAVIAFGVVCLVSLAAPHDAGEIGRDVEGLLRLLSGAGAYIVPVLAFVVGTLLLFGKLRVQFSQRAFAAVGIWLVIVSWLHVNVSTSPVTADLHFDPEALRHGGGFIGASVSYFLLVAVGKISSLVILAAAGLAALLVLVDVPVFSRAAELFHSLREQSSEAKPKEPKPEKAPRTKLAPVAETADEKPDRTDVIAKAIENRRRASEDEAAELIAADKKDILVNSAGPLSATNGSKKQDAQQQLAFSDSAPGDEDFLLPPLDLLDDSPPIPERSADELSEKVETIERTLNEFKIAANVVEIAHGPTVTRYEIELAPGIRVNKIVSLADNIAMSLAAINVRVEAPIPGKAAIGVEVPNRHRGLIQLKDVLSTPELVNHPSKLAFPLGLDVAGRPIVADLCTMPHLLVAGATNMGKSVMLNSLISSILFRARPSEVRMILIDPKRVELSLFDGIPHLSSPVIKEVRAAAGIFRAAVQEMERRYDKLALKGTRNIQNYNEMVEPIDRLPYVVIVVDELADLMMQAAAEVEGSICRIAQLARAVGIHLVIATQRPSVDVVTGTIKANIASRIAFAVSSHIDSRTILDQNGAERLIGKGDMLFRPIDAPKPVRIQGAYISEQEVKRLVTHLREQRAPSYNLVPVEPGATGDGGGGGGSEGFGDPALADEFYQPAVELVVRLGKASTSMIQRKYRIGYTRAARLVDAMEQQGIVGPPDGANPREVLLSQDRINELFGLPSQINAAQVPAGAAAEDDFEDDEEQV